MGRRIILAIVLACLLSTAAHAATYTLAWDAETSGTATGYRVFWHDATGSYDYNTPGCDVDDLILQCDVTVSGAFPFYFVARAYNANGESVDSNEVISVSSATSGSVFNGSVLR
jgi:hypothetical protein